MSAGAGKRRVKLAYCQEPTEDEIRRLDLGAVAEFRSNLGSVEIRFIDRVKALQALAGMLEGEGCEAEEFFPRDGAGGGGNVKEMIPPRCGRGRRSSGGRRNTRTMRRSSATALSARARRWRWGMGFFFWAMACFSDRQFALCGRSVGALRRNLLETVLPQLRRLGFACEREAERKAF